MGSAAYNLRVLTVILLATAFSVRMAWGHQYIMRKTKGNAAYKARALIVMLMAFALHV